MHLLVSVSNAVEAAAALEGGADVIDAKDPAAGALGAVSLGTLAAIRDAVRGVRPLTAALGDAADEARVEQTARDFAAGGAALVKVGFAGITDADRATALATAAVRGAASAAAPCGVVAVAYADAARVGALAPDALVAVAARAGADGVLLDTADKSGPGLLGLVDPAALAAWVRDARAAGLLVALAGKLAGGDLAAVRDTGADIVGVRGAACAGGRTGRVVADQVRALQALCAGPPATRALA